MAESDELARGRAACERCDWATAFAELAAADRESRLQGRDLELYATAACLVGEDAEARAAWTRLHHALIDEGRVEEAARWGFWLSLQLLLAGEIAQGTGWLARSQRLLRGREGPCVATGYELVVGGLMSMGKGKPEEAGAAFQRAVAFATDFADGDLMSLALLGRGQTLVQARRLQEGTARLDEAMVAVTSGGVSPVLAGIVYCAVILTCRAAFDLARAGEWTRALDRWCERQSGLVPYRGQCLVHRSEILQLRGDWVAALAAARAARAHLADRSEAVVGRAYYQLGDLHRLRGEFADAEEMYRSAGRSGREPQPGLALLRLAEGRVDTAAAAIRTALETAEDVPGPGRGPPRAEMLLPSVDIMLAAGDFDAARGSAEDLARKAEAVAMPLLAAMSGEATGALLLAEGEPAPALRALRGSLASWQELGAVYETARLQARLGAVFVSLGDDEAARMHLDAARRVFAELGAGPDLARVDRPAERAQDGPAASLSAREREVLTHVAAGCSNRDIAGILAISEHTVARHLSNIFDKLGVSSRTAAAAFAHAHRLVRPERNGQS